MLAIHASRIVAELGAQPRSDAIRTRPAPHLVRFDELKYIPLCRVGLLPGDDSRTSHVLRKGLSELPEIRIILKNNDGLIRLNAHHGQPRIAKFVGDQIDGSFFRQGHAKDQMRSESLNCRNALCFRGDLPQLVQKLLAECGTLAAGRSGLRKGLALSPGRVFLHPDQRQMRMPLVFRMVRHVIGRDPFRSVQASLSRRRRRRPFVSAGARCFL